MLFGLGIGIAIQRAFFFFFFGGIESYILNSYTLVSVTRSGALLLTDIYKSSCSFY